MQLARAVRNRTTGVLYVLDEPSIGLHPSNIVGLTGVMHDLVADGNSVILVDHDTQILKEADWIVEMGPEAGAKGGHVIAEGNIPMIEENPNSQIGPFLWRESRGNARDRKRPKGRAFRRAALSTCPLTQHPYGEAARSGYSERPPDRCYGRFRLRQNDAGARKALSRRLRRIFSGESATGAREARSSAEGIDQVKLIDATPIGINVRSTVATYAGVHDELRKALRQRLPTPKEARI